MASQSVLDLYERLLVGTYAAVADLFGDHSLEQVGPFRIGTKLYSDTEAHSEGILGSFRKRRGSAGV